MFNQKEYTKQWRKDNQGKIKKYQKQYCKDNREYIKEYCKRYYLNNTKKVNEYSKKYYKENSERAKVLQKNWHKDNLEYIKEYYRNRHKTDLKFNLNHKMRTAIYKSLKGNKNGRHWEILVGYTLNNLIKHLQKTLPQNCIWQDYLNGDLHIDHKIPISAHNYSKPEHTDFKRCWALENLRLLPAKENIIKNNKLTKSFQPALKI